MSTGFDTPLVVAGERVTRTLRYTREDIAHFARLTYDFNPLHYDVEAAQRARFGEIIAPGQQTSAIMMGLAATYFSRDDDGLKRQMLCLNFNFSYKLPVFADEDLLLSWTVASAEWNTKLGGQVALLDGVAQASPARPSVVARGTILVKHAIQG